MSNQKASNLLLETAVASAVAHNLTIDRRQCDAGAGLSGLLLSVLISHTSDTWYIYAFRKDM